MQSIKLVTLLCLLLLVGSINNFVLIVTPSRVEAQAGVPNLGIWEFYEDSLGAAPTLNCPQPVPEGGFILGADTSCNPGKLAAIATTTIHVPSAPGERVLLLRVICPGEEGCADAVRADGAGSITLSVDGQILWSVRCEAAGKCNLLALGESPEIAFVTMPPNQHRLTLTASAHVLLTIERIEVSWQEIPQLIRGIAYSPFRDCQNPHFGPFPTIAQIHQDMATLRHMGNAIRTYSSTGVQGMIPAIARQYGLRVSAGAALGPEHTPEDKERNEAEIAHVIALSRTVDLESIIVGNEVLLRGDLNEDELIAYLDRVQTLVDVPVTTAATAGEYYNHPRLLEHVDYALIHIYSFWQNQPIENGARFVIQQYQDLQRFAGNKHIIIGETGWPSNGSPVGVAVPSPENQRRFLREFLTLAQQEDVEFYFFSAFNELWKTEGGVGPFWGVLDSERRSQYDLQSVLIPLNDPVAILTNSNIVTIPTTTATPTGTGENAIFPVYTDYAVLLEHYPAGSNHFAPSGFMGDIHTLYIDTCAYADDSWQNRAISLQYTPSGSDLGGWAGVYWQTPDNNWGNVPNAGYDLTGYAQVRFVARAETDGTQVQFFVGGISDGSFPSSVYEPIYAQEADSEGFITLTTEWQEYHIDLRNADLHHVIDGFGWLADRFHTPDGATVFVDNILYDTNPPPEIMVSPFALASSLVIVDGNRLSRGFSLGVDTSHGQRDWLTSENDFYRLDYPANQDWGAVFITVGDLQGVPETLDLSEYAAVAIDIRGERGGEVVSIGIKDNTDDERTETKFPISLTTTWRTFVFPLAQFTTADLTRIYIPIEIVFEPGTPAETVYIRNIRYLRSALGIDL